MAYGVAGVGTEGWRGDKTMGHTFPHILLHVVFGTKQRRHDLFPQMREGLLSYLSGIVRRQDAELLAASAVSDHVHMLVAVKPVHSASDLVCKVKANSSRWIHERHAALQGFGWQSGFGVFSASGSAVEDVVSYIRRQEEHHRQVPFEEELTAFPEKHGIPYDRHHLLD